MNEWRFRGEVVRIDQRPMKGGKVVDGPMGIKTDVSDACCSNVPSIRPAATGEVGTMT